ncbi:molybdopterin-dependent oxidoreductase [Lachnospiraceae bacterium ZAX-1]
MDEQNAKDIVARAKIYGYFSAAFSQPPNRHTLDEFLSIEYDGGRAEFAPHSADVAAVEFAPHSADVAAVEFASHSADVATAVEFSDEEWKELSREYSYVFERCSLRTIPLWESAFVSGILLDETTLSVKRSYRRRGLNVWNPSYGPVDHIWIECDFLKILTQDLLDAFYAKTESAFTKKWLERKKFLEEHFLMFAMQFAQRLLQASAEPYFQSLARFLREFAESEYATLYKNVDSGNIYGGVDDFYKNSSIPQFFHAIKAAAGKEVEAESEVAVESEVEAEIEMESEVEALNLDGGIVTIPTTGRNNCGRRCIILADVAEGCVLKTYSRDMLGGNSDEPLIQCVRGAHYRDSFLNPERLMYPMRRVGKRGEGLFERISWDEATDIIAEQLKVVKEKYGPTSRYVNYASGVAASISGSAIAQRLLSLDGGYLDLYNSYSSACAGIATPYSYGTSVSGSTSDTLTDSKLIILWGHNPMESGFGNAVFADLKKAKEKGIKIIVIDPRQGDTARALSAEWIAIRPTTDSALADAMAYVMITENLHDKAFLDKYCIGFDKEHMPEGSQEVESVMEYILGMRDHAPKTPEWAEEITGISADKIKYLARLYATGKPAALIPGLGPQRHGNGEQTVRSLTMLASMTGNVGIRGGGAAGCGFVYQHAMPMLPPLKNPAGVSIPSFLWTKAITHGTRMTASKDGVAGCEKLTAPIKLILNLAGNTLVNQHSDINKTISILQDESLCEFIVCSDVFMNASAKFADILLPGASMFETENIGFPWRQGDYLLYGNKVIEPMFESRFEFDWLVEVGEKMGIGSALTDGHKTLREWLKSVYNLTREKEPELPDFEDFAKCGGHKYANRTTFVAFEKQIADIENNPFQTPSGKIELFSKRLYGMDKPKLIPAIPKYVPSFEGPCDERIKTFPLQLIGWHTKRRAHSVHDHNMKLEKLDPQRMWMNPKDARARGLSDGDTAEVFNARGRLRIPILVTERIMSGVVAIAQGAWYTPGADGIDTRGSINVLTTQRPTPLAYGNPQHTNLVQVRKFLKPLNQNGKGKQKIEEA